MKGDFSRLTFDAKKHFSRVMMQQGRVQLDADWNEQHAISLHYLQTLAKDLIGDHGGPKNDLGFAIITDPKEIPETIRQKESKDSFPFFIGKGRYYVNGIQITAEKYHGVFDQPDYPHLKKDKFEAGNYLVYLDVWEHHITSFEDASIREVALENLDTASRAKIVWQVKTVLLANGEIINDTQEASKKLEALFNKPRAYLSASTSQKGTSNTPCTIAPESTYRGQENQLYRVEIYEEDKTFKLKWARDNASIVTAAELKGNSLKVSDARGFSAGQWVEITNNDQEYLEQSGQLIKIKSISDNELTLEKTINTPLVSTPKVRRWDGANIAVQDKEAIPLADGVVITFKADVTKATEYRSGDYWLIPVRVATGKVEWPDEPQPPYGINHNYAPLATIEVQADGGVNHDKELRKEFESLATPVKKFVT
jgi:hypothetical protein